MKTLYINISGESINSTEELIIVGRAENSIEESFYYELGTGILEGISFPSDYHANKVRLITDFRDYDPESFHFILEQWDNLKNKLFNLKLEDKCEIILPQKYISWLKNNREPSYAIIAKHLFEKMGSVNISIEGIYLNSIDILLANINADDYSSFVINDESITEDSGIVSKINERIGNVPFESYNKWKDRYYFKIPKEFNISEEDIKINQCIELLVNTNCLQVETDGNIERLILYFPAVPELLKIGSAKSNMNQEEMKEIYDAVETLNKKKYLLPFNNSFALNWSVFFAQPIVYPKKSIWPSDKWVKYLRTYFFKLVDNNVCSPIPDTYGEPGGLKDNWMYLDLTIIILQLLINDYGVCLDYSVSNNIFKIKSTDNLFGLAYKASSSERGLICVPSFKSISKMKEGMMVVQGSNGLYGFINVKGEIVVPCKYSRAHDFSNGYARVWLNGVEMFINQDGEEKFEHNEHSQNEVPLASIESLKFENFLRSAKSQTSFLKKMGETAKCDISYDKKHNAIKDYFYINGIILGQMTEEDIIHMHGELMNSSWSKYRMPDGTCCGFLGHSKYVNYISIECGERIGGVQISPECKIPEFYRHEIGLSWATTVNDFREKMERLGFENKYDQDNSANYVTVHCKEYQKFIYIYIYSFQKKIYKYEFKCN